jgi:hypothetical protein
MLVHAAFYLKERRRPAGVLSAMEAPMIDPS